MKNNWTGWGAGMIFAQWLFYYFSLYLDTVLFDTNVIYAFYNQWCYNWFAWLGNFAVFAIVMVIDPAFYKLGGLIKRIGARCTQNNDYRQFDPYKLENSPKNGRWCCGDKRTAV